MTLSERSAFTDLPVNADRVGRGNQQPGTGSEEAAKIYLLFCVTAEPTTAAPWPESGQDCRPTNLKYTLSSSNLSAPFFSCPPPCPGGGPPPCPGLLPARAAPAFFSPPAPALLLPAPALCALSSHRPAAPRSSRLGPASVRGGSGQSCGCGRAARGGGTAPIEGAAAWERRIEGLGGSAL